MTKQQKLKWIVAAGTLLLCCLDLSFHPLVKTNQLSEKQIDHLESSLIPEAWQRFNAPGMFTFYLPQGFSEDSAIGIETYHRTYTDGSLQVSVEYGGAYVQSKARSNGPLLLLSKELIKVGGRDGILTRYRNSERKEILEAYVPDVGNYQQRFALTVSFENAPDLALAKQIISGVKFKSEDEV